MMKKKDNSEEPNKSASKVNTGEVQDLGLLVRQAKMLAALLQNNVKQRLDSRR